MKYQLWNQDEYGKGIIVGTFETHSEAITKARKLVTDANFSNSLSSVEQMRNIEAYFVDFGQQNNIDNNHIYAGNRRGGKFWSFKIGQNKTASFDPAKRDVSIYIGSKFAKTASGSSETMIYLLDEKKRPISRVDHDVLNGKSIYFIVPVD